MKVKILLNDEEEKEIKEFINNLLEDKELNEGDFIESGGFGVRVSDILNDVVIFDIYRIIGTVDKIINKKEK